MMAMNRHIRLRPSDVFGKNDPSDPSYEPWLDSDFGDRLIGWLHAQGLDMTDNAAVKDFGERWRQEALAKASTAKVVDAMGALEGVSLLRAYFENPFTERTVGDFLLHCPSVFRIVKDDEAYELNRARAAAVHDTEMLDKFSAGMLDDAEAARLKEEEDLGTGLLLLRPTRIVKDDSPLTAYHMDVRSGDTIEVDAVQVNVDGGAGEVLRNRCWVVVKVWAYFDDRDDGEVQFGYDLVLAVPDNGPLRVSDVHPSLSRALCFDNVCRYLLSGLDLSEESLPDPLGAMQFINRIHRDGLPPGWMGPPRKDDGRNNPFRQRLLDAMSPTARSTTGSAAPERRLIKTYRDAEIYAAEYMRHLGFADATPTPTGSDGGIDVDAGAAIAQVKMEGVATGRPVIQALFGVATVEGKSPLMFSLAGYTAQALEWADQAEVACFEFATDGSVVAVNTAARELQPPGQ